MINWSVEYPQIEAICLKRNVDPFFIAAIRSAENGAPGREFGVLRRDDAQDYAGQLRVCTRTIAGYLAGFRGDAFDLLESIGLKRACYSPAFISYCAGRYAPIGASNDLTNLNQNWSANVSQAYFGFVTAGCVA